MSQPEVWLRGPIDGISPLLQPVAHGLLQCREEVAACLPGLTDAQLSARPGSAAAIAYHVQHAMGSLDRLFTYARDESLSEQQRAALAAEANAATDPPPADELVKLFAAAIERALAQLRATDEVTLREERFVGRARLPSNVVGLLFHAAEHTQRHVGQMVTTAKVVRGTHSDGQ